jgi:hypothetical protein
MKKSIYISPQAMVVTISPMRLIAESLPKGEGEFDPGNMTFTKENTSITDKNVWDNEW